MELRRTGLSPATAGPLRTAPLPSGDASASVRSAAGTDRLQLGTKPLPKPVDAEQSARGDAEASAAAASKAWIARYGRPVGADAIAHHKSVVDAAHALGSRRAALTQDLKNLGRMASRPDSPYTAGEVAARRSALQAQLGFVDRGLAMLRHDNLSATQARRLEDLLGGAGLEEGLERTPQEIDAALVDMTFLSRNPEPHAPDVVAQREALVAATLLVSSARQDILAGLEARRAMVGRKNADGHVYTPQEYKAYAQGQQTMLRLADKAMRLLKAGDLPEASARELGRLFQDMGRGDNAYTPQEVHAKLVSIGFEAGKQLPLSPEARAEQTSVVNATLQLASMREDIRAELQGRAAMIGKKNADGHRYTPEEHRAFVMARATTLRHVEEGLRLLEHGQLPKDAIDKLGEAFEGYGRPDGTGLERAPQEMDAILAGMAYASRRRVPFAESGQIQSAALSIGSAAQDLMASMAQRLAYPPKGVTPAEQNAWKMAIGAQLGMLEKAQGMLRRGELRPDDAQRIAGMLTRTEQGPEYTPQEIHAVLVQAAVRGRQSDPAAPASVTIRHQAQAAALHLSSVRQDLAAEMEARAAMVGRKSPEGREFTPQEFQAFRLSQSARIAVVDDALRALERRDLGSDTIEQLRRLAEEAAGPRNDARTLTTPELRQRLDAILRAG
ncbi:MAG: hypothetical protein VKO64_00320 [Candidatus Sericytochromatia bacterium]|nr:hypothetical protein [Candidatus Sericytochromatia bacterium]